MTDENQDVSGETQETTEQQPPTYVTQQELEQRLTSTLQQIQNVANNVYRGVQGLQDSATSRFDTLAGRLEQIDQETRRLRASGQPVPQETIDKAKNKIIEDSLLGASQALPTQDVPPEEVRQVYEGARQIASGLYNEYGIELLDSDPEIRSVNISSPDAFLNTMRQALESKKARLAQAGNKPETQQGGSQQREPEQQRQDSPRETPVAMTGQKANQSNEVWDPDYHLDRWVKGAVKAQS